MGNAPNLTDSEKTILFDILRVAEIRIENGAPLSKAIDRAEDDLTYFLKTGDNPNE